MGWMSRGGGGKGGKDLWATCTDSGEYAVDAAWAAVAGKRVASKQVARSQWSTSYSRQAGR